MLPADEDRESLAAVGSRRGADLGEQVVEIAAADLQGIVRDLAGTLGIVEIEDRGLGKGVGRAVAERVEGIALDLGRATVGGGDDDRDGARGGRHRARVVEELAGDGPFGRLRKGNKMSLGAPASRESHAGQCGGGTHEAHEVTAGETILVTARGGIRELTSKPLGEGSGTLALLQRTPEGGIGLAGWMGKNLLHRWQPPQLTGGLIFQSALNFSPISRCSVSEAGCQSMLKTSEGGRRKFSGERWQSRHHFMLSDWAS